MDKNLEQNLKPLMGAETGAFARKYVSNILSDQVSKIVGSTFNFDFVEISAQDSWQYATFVVGKYITTDLFVSYEQRLWRRP